MHTEIRKALSNVMDAYTSIKYLAHNGELIPEHKSLLELTAKHIENLGDCLVRAETIFEEYYKHKHNV
jgi:hypothetical protein